MSLECSECEHDLRGGHAEDCSRARGGSDAALRDVSKAFAIFRGEREADYAELYVAVADLAAEVESLRVQNGKLHVAVEAEYQHGYADGAAEATAEAESLRVALAHTRIDRDVARAAVARIREVCGGAHNDASGVLVVYADEVLHALGEA